MTVDETLQLARSYDVEVRLNAAGDGLDLEIAADPPEAPVNVLRRAKWDIVGTLRQQESERRRPLIAGWIKDHFVSTPPSVCRHCGKGAREDDVFVRLYCGDDTGDVHTSCQPAWQEAEEARASAALGLGPLTGLFDRHFPLLYDIEEAGPRDVSDAGWDLAMRGLRAFLAAGHADEALRLGWPKDELFAVPPVWASIDLCGAALLIGDREVVDITPNEIRIKTASGATLSIYRKLEIDYALGFETRLKLTRGNFAGDSEEPTLRAIERAVMAYRQDHVCDIDSAKQAVLAAIAAGEARTKPKA